MRRRRSHSAQSAIYPVWYLHPSRTTHDNRISEWISQQKIRDILELQDNDYVIIES
jgi:CTP-dependent riboflavin kinase